MLLLPPLQGRARQPAHRHEHLTKGTGRQRGMLGREAPLSPSIGQSLRITSSTHPRHQALRLQQLARRCPRSGRQPAALPRATAATPGAAQYHIAPGTPHKSVKGCRHIHRAEVVLFNGCSRHATCQQRRCQHWQHPRYDPGLGSTLQVWRRRHACTKLRVMLTTTSSWHADALTAADSQQHCRQPPQPPRV